MNTYGQDRQEAPYGAAPYIQSLAGGVLRKARCNRCGAPAAWAKSKSGRWYLCEVFAKAHSDDVQPLRAAPWRPHKCREGEAR